MVRCWYMDDSSSDQRLPHMTDPPKFITLEELKAKTGVEYYKVDADNYKQDAILQGLRKDRNYNYEDTVKIDKNMPALEDKLKMFFQEHIHSDEEIRLILDGSGYFDARDKEDQWIRIEVSKGDLIILPAGIYHRFTLDTQNYTIANRYFIGEPVWTPINRPADQHEARVEYKKTMSIH